MDEQITITAAEYQRLQDDSNELSALQEAGVDNWSGYDFAMDILRERGELCDE